MLSTKFIRRMNVFSSRNFAVLSRPTLPAKYDNFIDGKFAPPVDGKYFDNVSPIGKKFT